MPVKKIEPSQINFLNSLHLKPETFTKLFNFFFELLPNISESEIKVYLIVLRETVGWNKEWAVISISSFQERTGLSNKAVIDGIKSLTSKRLIDVKKESTNKAYKILNYHSIDTSVNSSLVANERYVNSSLVARATSVNFTCATMKNLHGQPNENPITPSIPEHPKEILKKININTHKERKNPVCVGNLISRREEEEREEKEADMNPSAKQPKHTQQGTPDLPNIFNAFIDAYPMRPGMSIKDAFAVWATLTRVDQENALEGSLRYREQAAEQSFKTEFTRHPKTFLEQRLWEHPATIGNTIEAKAPVDTKKLDLEIAVRDTLLDLSHFQKMGNKELIAGAQKKVDEAMKNLSEYQEEKKGND